MATSGMQHIPLLMALSLGVESEGESAQSTNNEKDTSPNSTTTASTVSSPFVVKNTFIELLDGEEAPCEEVPRRSKSAPATPRAAASMQSVLFHGLLNGIQRKERAQSDGNMKGMASDDVDELAPTPTARPKFGLQKQAWSTMSDTTDADDFDDLRTETGTQVGSDSGSDASQFASDASKFEAVPIALADLLHGHLAKQPPRISLSSKARAWTPKAPGPSSCIPSLVKLQFMKVLTAGQAALRSCMLFENVQLCERPGGWSLAAGARAALLPAQVQFIMTAVKQAILQAAGHSDNIYVVGYERMPFVPAPGCGFSFRLALVQDETTACWDLLTSGCCSRGSCCPYKHPSWHAAVDVSLTQSF